MSVLKNLKSLFIVEDETEVSAAKDSGGDQISVPSNARVIAEGGKVNPKFTEVLLQAMEQNNLDGFDYLEFKRSLQSLQNMPMDQATKYRSAFAMAQSMGINTQKLLSSAQHYLDILKNEEKKFGEALANQEQQKIGSKHDEIKRLETSAQQKSEQIKKLTEEIQQHQKQAEALKSELAASSGKMEATRRDFQVSLDQLVTQIQADLTNMKDFLK